MPVIFESVQDETELLLPDNLLHSNSPVQKMVSEINEEDWREIEIVGWLYQFYISEKERPGHRQGGQGRGHPGGHPAVYSQLDRQVHGPEYFWTAMAGYLP